MAPSQVYIAGVGLSPLPEKNSSTEALIATSISAATKALLDAGVTYDDITHGVVSRSSEHLSKTFKAFDDEGVTVKELKPGSELGTSFALIKDQGAQSILMIAREQSAVIAFVLISDNFLWSRSYLKDSSAVMRHQSNSTGNAHNKLHDVCKMIWELRGWTDSNSQKFVFHSPSSGTFEFDRSDEKEKPKWEDIEHKQDGKHRLGYNPAKETKEVYSEDLDAVVSSRARGGEARNRPRLKRRGGDRAVLARL